MMDYEMFKEMVRERFQDYMPKPYRKMEMEIIQVNKVNQVLDGINLFGDGPTAISPTIYINDMYQSYQETGNLERTFIGAADFMVRAAELYAKETYDLDLEKAKDNIVFQLVNTGQNEAMLAEMPHRQFQDLSIIYRWMIKAEETGIESCAVTHNLAGRLGMDEKELFERAAENTRRILPPVTRCMNDIMRTMIEELGMPSEIKDMMFENIPTERAMWVISNAKGINGASSMLYEEELHKLAEKLGCDLYILPSSVHEVIAVPADLGEPEALAEMVAQVNQTEVSLADRLSNQVYHYDKDLRRLGLATDTPNKRLDGMVAEPQLSYDTREQAR